jgi:hypothetical protein
MALDETDGAGGTGGDTGGAADLVGGGTGGDQQHQQQQDGGGGGDQQQQQQEAAPDWYEKLSGATSEGETASNRDWVQSLGVKDLDGLVKVARDNQRAARDGDRIKVPGEGAKPEEIAEFRKSIGVPEDGKGYEIKGPEGVKLNQPLIDRLADAAAKSGVPKGAFEATVGEYIKAQLDEATAENTRQDGLAADWVKAQGAKKDEQLAHVDTAARALGFTRGDMQAMRSSFGADRALTILAKLGSGMAEDTMLTGGKGRFGVTTAEATAEIERLKSDPEFQKKVLVPGSPERQRWDRLNKAQAEGRAKAEDG